MISLVITISCLSLLLTGPIFAIQFDTSLLISLCLYLFLPVSIALIDVPWASKSSSFLACLSNARQSGKCGLENKTP